MYKRILNGIETSRTLREATRRYCGDYDLVRRIADGKLFRSERGQALGGFVAQDGAVYDEDGYLLAQFWSLPALLSGSSGSSAANCPFCQQLRARLEQAQKDLSLNAVTYLPDEGALRAAFEAGWGMHVAQQTESGDSQSAEEAWRNYSRVPRSDE